MALPEIWTAALGFGFVLGLRHALEPDHIVAVSNIVSTSRDLRRSSLVGTYWGLGHTAALFAAGIAVIGMKLTIPKNLALWMELAVATMLCALGWQTIVATRKRMQDRRNPNDHSHDYSHEHSHDQPKRPGMRPFLVGVVHGFAGSGALMLLVLGTIPTALAGLGYILMFGLGSTGGMLVMSCAIGAPFMWTSGRFHLITQALQMLVGFGSMIFGGFYAFQQFAAL